MKCSCPHMGNYWIAFGALFRTIGLDFSPPPPITKRTLELGVRFSPEFVCIPFKFNLGNLIEAAEEGADIMFQSGGRGACRYGSYLDMQERILKDLGFNLRFVRLFATSDLASSWRELKRLNPKINLGMLLRMIRVTSSKIRAIDSIEDTIRRRWPYLKERSEVEHLYRVTLKEIDQTDDPVRLKRIVKDFKREINTREIPLSEPPIKIGIVGEIYVVIEPYSNLELERQLREMEVEVVRPLTLSFMLKEFFSLGLIRRHHFKVASAYLKYDCCAHANTSVAETIIFAQEGFDGVIHVKPHACMPEITSMSALHRVSRDYNIPILFLSFDEHSSSVGLRTRLEAFVELLKRRRRCS